MDRILFIEDDAPFRTLISNALRSNGYEVLEAESAEEGVDLARENLPDLILCDIHLASASGLDVLKDLGENPKTGAIPFILATGSSENQSIRRGMEAGADDYLIKPFSIASLLAAIRTRLRKHHFVLQESERRLEGLRQTLAVRLPHEIKTPLSGILTLGELLQTYASQISPSEIEKMAGEIVSAGKRLLALTEQILLLGQINILETGHTSFNCRQTHSVDVSGLLSETALKKAATLKRDSDLKLDVVSQKTTLVPDLLIKVATEVLDNAFKFSKPGFPVIFTIRASKDGGTTWTIQDHGRGMTPEQIASVGAYVQFEREKYEQRGIGLGLVIAMKLTHLLDGEFLIESQPNNGTTITLTWSA